ncbi:cytochrome P450 oxidoreductase OrdA-like, putative [Trichophyton benhamiae CBS 112371]|uniref:Bifunctional cytochrome P450/NADPH--P450 reductase n=1 Tax=Arthroderma benhamiae (strain ATCC MYA-4681 / CBS 112371) TaxID=663331 RepID=D4ALN3_ARTBC|nr:cytochrome P450 oxidoreductase OrdA-like, putative [Trichophyton benhamiae CBS 112371]EFE36292.1 cytochrome P450 oxidoreductase OrdA-like, putative [Trichophyton benhamiae CBS 112371]
MSEPIPGPAPLPIVGNAYNLDLVNSFTTFGNLTDTYGPIFKLTLGGEEKIFITTQSLMDEVCNEKRFSKLVAGSLAQIRNGVQDGLFTAHPGEHNWEIAHRVLMPAFGPSSIRAMFDEMHDIASQLVIKWARFGPNEKIHVTDDFTRLTLDSIALCAMGTRFNSFYHEDMHPFVHAMVGFLAESGARASRPAVVQYFMHSAQQQYDADIELMKKVAGDLVADRKANPNDKKDLLNAMLKGKDARTGEHMTEDSIMNNMITFLIAGHETTSGLLSFLFYYLLKHPSAYQAAQRQVDEVVGRGPITVEHMSKLPYIEACMRETLRLSPSAIAIQMQPRPDGQEDPIYLGKGKYEIKKGQAIVCVIPQIHRDPTVYGDDANLFRPERMLDEPFAKLPKNSWKPFGNGVRGCIGRPFAWQETILTAVMLLQNFNLRFDDPSYQLQIKQTLTIKPKDFFMRATLRHNVDPVQLEKMLHVNIEAEAKAGEKDRAAGISSVGPAKKPMTILYGSNAGTCEALAQNLARDASSRGYSAQVGPLDSGVDKVPKDQPVIVISSSYEGQPPDNAAHFVEWIQGLGSGAMTGVKYAVYGCGNHDWTSTFHRIPKLLDAEFKRCGATRVADVGLGDVADGDIFNHFDKWQDEQLWSSIGGDVDPAEEGTVEVDIDTDARKSTLRQDVREATVISNKVLTAPGEPEKRHLILTLPTGMSYKSGDYLARNIRRALNRYNLPWDAMLTIKVGANTTLPTGHPVSAMDVLSAYVELGQPATRKNVARIASSISDEKVREEVLALSKEGFENEILKKCRSPLDLLEEYPTAELPLGDFLAMLPPMRIRQYSISSSPLADPTVASITWSVLDAPSRVADSKRFLGVASNFLSKVQEGDRIHVAVKPSHGNFHPPKDTENTPLMMFCAGTGLAPFHGFVQERAIQIQAGRKVAPAYLFIGCRHPERDALFKDELQKWETDGVVTVFYAFSAASEQSKHCRYVQDRLWEERGEMRKVFDQGAKLYVCGTSRVGEGIASTVKKIFQDYCASVGKPKTDEEVERWFQDIKSDRFSSDVFA